MNQTQVKPSEVNSLLNGLIEICRDGQSGFADAAEHLKIEPWETFCLEQSRQRARYVGELQQQIQWLGGEPENSGSATGAIHRAWLDLTISLAQGGEDDVARLHSVGSFLPRRSE